MAAPVRSPVSLPAQHRAAAHHGAGDIANPRRDAPCRGASSAGPAVGTTPERRPLDQDVTLSRSPGRRAEKSDKRVACRRRGGSRAWLVRAAGAVALARGDPGEAQPRPLDAPYRAVAVPYAGRRACECLTCGDNDGGESDEEHRMSRYTRLCRASCSRMRPAINAHHPVDSTVRPKCGHSARPEPIPKPVAR